MTPARGLLARLRAPGLAVACGLATALLLGVGSVVLTVTAGGASRTVAGDDLRAFFTDPAPAHLWLYLLVPVVALLAVNGVLCTVETVRSRWRAGARAPSAYASVVVHLALLVALAAHLAGGLLGRDLGEIVVGPQPTALPDGRVVRLVDLAVDRLPGGRPRAVAATLAVTAPGAAAPTPATVGFNAPLARGLGAELYLLADFGERPSAARLATAAGECTLAPGAGCTLGGRAVTLARLWEHHGRLLAQVVVDGAEPEWLMAARPLTLPDGGTLRLAGVVGEPVVTLRGRRSAGVPLALGAALLLALGLALMTRRLVRG